MHHSRAAVVRHVLALTAQREHLVLAAAAWGQAARPRLGHCLPCSSRASSTAAATQVDEQRHDSADTHGLHAVHASSSRSIDERSWQLAYQNRRDSKNVNTNREPATRSSASHYSPAVTLRSKSQGGLRSKNSTACKASASTPTTPPEVASSAPEPTARERILRLDPSIRLPDHLDFLLGLSKPTLVRYISRIISLPRPNSIASLQAHTVALRTLLDHLTPVSWANVQYREHAGLLALWAAWLDRAEELREWDALPRAHGTKGRAWRAEQFTPLLIAALRPVPRKRHHHAVEPPAFRKRLAWTVPALQSTAHGGQKHAIEGAPTPARVLDFMASVNIIPTPLQLQLLVQHIPLVELLSRAEKSNWYPKEDAFNSTAGRLTRMIVPPSTLPALDFSKPVGSLPQREQVSRERRNLGLAISDVVVGQLETANHRNINLADTAAWQAARSDMRRGWIRLVTPYVERASAVMMDAATTALPSNTDSHVLHLLVRDAILPTHEEHVDTPAEPCGVFDLGDPVDLVRLLLGVSTAGESITRPGDQNQRVVSAIVRMATAAAEQNAAHSALHLLSVLADPSPFLPTPQIPLRTAVTFATTARTAEAAIALFPVLGQVPVCPYDPDSRSSKLGKQDARAHQALLGPGTVPTVALEEILRVARMADLSGGTGVEKGVREMFRRWNVKVRE